MRAVLTELLEHSEEFRELWSMHDARGKSLEMKRLLHPQIGELTLRMQAFDVRSAPGHELVVYHAEPDGRSAEVLSVLSALVNW